ncbi:DUF3592 domain-containing protein [Actinomadura sp. NPDC049382]
MGFDMGGDGLPWWLWAAVAAAVLYMLISGAACLVKARWFARNGTRASAEIVGWQFPTYNSSLGGYGWSHNVEAPAVRVGGVFGIYPVLEFTTSDGREIQARTQVSEQFPRRRGTAVAILHDPADPERVRIDDLRGRGFLNGTYAVVSGLVGAAAGLWFYSALG